MAVIATSPPDPSSVALEALADRVRRLCAGSSAHRIVLGITGSPGAGKTTLARAIAASLNDGGIGTGTGTGAGTGAGTRTRVGTGTDAGTHTHVAARDATRAHQPTAVHLPMDGFHLANSTLDRLGLRQRKGATETFDGWGFVAMLERVLRETEHTVYAPAFERHLDEPVAGEIAIEPSVRVVVVEGNYLLSRLEPWHRVRDLLAESWFCETDEGERMLRLVRRHTASGRTPDAALAWATDVDGANARRIAPSRDVADLVVSGDTWQVLADRLQV
jgi:pantothenate kinase